MSERVVLTRLTKIQAASAGHQAGEGVDGELGAVDRQAGEARGGLVVADGVERAAEGGAGRTTPNTRMATSQEPELGRDAERRRPGRG